jgi:UDP-galactopyranose mutase
MKNPEVVRYSTPYSMAEVDIFNEGKCLICHKRGHIGIDCPDKKNKKSDITIKPRLRK